MGGHIDTHWLVYIQCNFVANNREMQGQVSYVGYISICLMGHSLCHNACYFFHSSQIINRNWIRQLQYVAFSPKLMMKNTLHTQSDLTPLSCLCMKRNSYRRDPLQVRDWIENSIQTELQNFMRKPQTHAKKSDHGGNVGLIRKKGPSLLGVPVATFSSTDIYLSSWD